MGFPRFVPECAAVRFNPITTVPKFTFIYYFPSDFSCSTEELCEGFNLVTRRAFELQSWHRIDSPACYCSACALLIQNINKSEENCDLIFEIRKSLPLVVAGGVKADVTSSYFKQPLAKQMLLIR